MGSAVDLIRSSRLRHAEYADAAVVAEGSELILLAGSCPLHEDGTTAAPGDLVAQTRTVLENMEIALREAGVQVEDVAFIRVLVATDRREDLGTVWSVVRERFGDHDVPGTLQGVTVLGYPDQLVEIEAIAARTVR